MPNLSRFQRNGREDLEAAAQLFASCNESFNQRFTAEQLLIIYRTWARCDWDYLPDHWTEAQIQAGLVGIVPRWDDDEKPIEDLTIVRLPQTAPSPETVPGDVVQVAPGASRWADAFFVTVTEVRHWGVQGYALVIGADGKRGLAHIRLNHGDYVRIGVAEWMCQIDIDRDATP